MATALMTVTRGSGLDTTDNDKWIINRTCFTLDALYIGHNGSYGVFINEDRAEYGPLQDGDSAFRLNVVAYTCVGDKDRVVTIYSTVAQDEAVEDQMVYVLCATRETSQAEQVASVSVESVRLQDEIDAVQVIKTNDRRYFYMEHCEGMMFRLRSTAFDSFYLAVEENVSGQRRLCLKRITSTDTEHHLEVLFNFSMVTRE
jgi:hypothetical protein